MANWLLAAVTLTIWTKSGRSWQLLGLSAPAGVPLLVSVVLVSGWIALAVQQTRAIGRLRLRDERRAELKAKLANIQFLLPHTHTEYRWFTALSFTAGTCEELLYRGFLTWLLRSYFGLPVAIALTALLFGAGHLYQGPRGAAKAAAAAFVMSAVVLVTGWLIPAMIMHALTDASAGMLSLAVLQDTDQENQKSHSDEASSSFVAAEIG